MDEFITEYGVFAEDGSIDQEVETCAVSGQPVLGEHATMEQIGKSHFVRVLSQWTRLITPELRAKWYQECGEVVAVEEAAPEAPAADVQDKSTGRRSKSASAEVTEEI